MGVTAQASSNGAYPEWMLWYNGCGGQNGPAIAVDLWLDGHGGDSKWGRENASTYYFQGGDHYGIHSGSSAHFVMYYLVQQTGVQVDFGWPPQGCPDGGYWDEGAGQCLSPIIIDLKKGEVRKLTSAANGVLFDIDADGVLDQVSWTFANRKNQAFLALDRNGNGTIDDGSELFGNFTVPGAVNGFDALNKIEPNDGDGDIDANDPLYAKLKLWTDLNHNGISEPSELQPASNVLESIGLGADGDNKVDVNGNRFLYRGWAYFKAKNEKKDARLRDIYDIYLVKQ